ncbi:MAG: phage holin family protein, partial [Thiobacillus sp.]|nr:phage holin family protein [Thiobacillus sp.]
MSEPVPGAGKGLLDSLTLLAATLVAIAHTR